MKKSVLLCVVLVFLISCSSSSSDKVYITHSCSYIIPASWESSMSDEDIGMYSSEKDMEAINVSYGNYDVESQDYENEVITVDGEKVYLYKYKEDNAYYRHFQITKNDETYTFDIISAADEPPYYEKFLESIKIQ